MMKLAMSQAASGLLRALLARAGVSRGAIRLTRYRSTDWQSLTFTGERHEIGLSIDPQAEGGISQRLLAGLSDAEFDICGQIVADIIGETAANGEIRIEALTIAA